MTNQGPNIANEILIVNHLPDGLSYISDNGGGSYDSFTEKWYISSLGIGNSVKLNIVATVTENTIIKNIADLEEDMRLCTFYYLISDNPHTFCLFHLSFLLKLAEMPTDCLFYDSSFLPLTFSLTVSN